MPVGYRANLAAAGESDVRLAKRLQDNAGQLTTLSLDAAVSHMPRLQVSLKGRNGNWHFLQNGCRERDCSLQLALFFCSATLGAGKLRKRLHSCILGLFHIERYHHGKSKSRVGTECLWVMRWPVVEERCRANIVAAQAPMVSTGDVEPAAIVTQLRQALGKVDELSNERAGLEEALKVEKNRDNILPRIMASSGGYDALFKEEIRKYDKLKVSYSTVKAAPVPGGAVHDLTPWNRALPSSFLAG